MIKLKTGKGDIALDLLGFYYEDAKFTDAHILNIANLGFKWIRVFNASKDQMEPADYNTKHYDNVERVSEKLLKVDRKLAIDMSGYTKKNVKTMDHNDFVEMFVKSYRKIKTFIPINSLLIQVANELNKAPRGFEGNSKKDTMPEQMRKLFRWYKYMSDILEAEGFPRNQIVGNCEDNKNYPKVPANAEAVIAGIRGMPKLGEGGKGKLEAKEMISAWHKILFPEDIPGRIYRAQRLKDYLLSDDGKSFSGKEGGGYWVVNKDGKKVYQSTNATELYNVTKATMELAKNGIRHGSGIHKVHIVYFMLPREKTYYSKKRGKFMFDLNKLDWDRMAVMPEAYKDVFGKYPEGWGQYQPEIIPEPIIPEPVDPKPKPIIIKEDKNMWQKIKSFLNFIYNVIAEANFPKWLNIISALAIIFTLIMLLIWIF